MPFRAKGGEQPLHSLGVAAGFLDGDDLEVRDDRGQLIACQSRFGESFGPASHLAARSPRARTFQVPIRRLVSPLAGMAWSSAALSRSRSSITAAGGCTFMTQCRQMRRAMERRPVRGLWHHG
jgi:hypothetical protein